jgi:hypothetical protein
MIKQRAAAIVHAIAARVRGWRKRGATSGPIDYKGWRITLTSHLSPGNGWSPAGRITAIDDPSVPETRLSPITPKFFATRTEADTYVTNMGIATIDTALGGWRVPGPMPAEPNKETSRR